MLGQVPPRAWHLCKQGHWISSFTQPGLGGDGDGGGGDGDGSDGSDGDGDGSDGNGDGDGDWPGLPHS